MTTMFGASTAKRIALGLGAAALAVGLVGLAPATANAASTQTITGKVTLAGGKKVKRADWGSIAVYDAKCNYVPSQSLTWKGNTYRVRVPKAGKYRVVYTGYPQVAHARYGVQSAPCQAGAKTVKVRKGKTAKRSLTVAPRGKAVVTTKKLKRGQVPVFFDVRTKKWVSSAGELPAGRYKLAKATWSDKKRVYVSQRVFGARGSSLARGKTIVVKPNRALKIDFEKGTVKPVKDFSQSIRVYLTGTAKLGATLTAKPVGFPKGTSFTYRWYSYGEVGSGLVAGAKGSSYRLSERDLAGTVSVEVTAKKRGYLDGWAHGYRSIGHASLTEKTKQRTSLDERTESPVGTEVAVTELATFDQSGVRADYSWTDESGHVLSTEPSFMPDVDLEGEQVTLSVTYSKPGYKAVMVPVTFTVVPVP